MMNTQHNNDGFTIVELLLAIIILPIVFGSMIVGFESINQSYKVSKEYNEIYAVLSACPEIDRALEYNSLTSSANCYPNNVFEAEGNSGVTLTYTPTVDVTNTTSLPNGDSLKNVPDSKVVDIKVPFLGNSGTPPQLRILITRNGIGQI